MIIRAAFWCGLLLLLALTLLPIQIEAPVLLDDKVKHFVSFLVLTTIGMVAWDKSRVRVGIGMILVGATIEALQVIPLIGRDPEFLDWIADTAGVALAAVLVGVYRRLVRSPGS